MSLSDLASLSKVMELPDRSVEYGQAMYILPKIMRPFSLLRNIELRNAKKELDRQLLDNSINAIEIRLRTKTKLRLSGGR